MDKAERNLIRNHSSMSLATVFQLAQWSTLWHRLQLWLGSDSWPGNSICCCPPPPKKYTLPGGPSVTVPWDQKRGPAFFFTPSVSPSCLTSNTCPFEINFPRLSPTPARPGGELGISGLCGHAGGAASLHTPGRPALQQGALKHCRLAVPLEHKPHPTLVLNSSNRYTEGRN